MLTGADPSSKASTIAKAAIVIMVMFSYPLQVHPCRASVDAVLKWRPKGRADVQGSPSRGVLIPKSAPKDGISDVRFAAITTTILVLSYIVAMTVNSLATVLAYVGSTGSTSISFILPGIFYYKISAPDSPYHQRLMKQDDDGDEEEDEDAGNEEAGLLGRYQPRLRNWGKGLLRKLSLALAIYGLVVMIVCLVTNTVFVAAH